MRSLTVKLTLAFVLVGAIGSILVAVIVSQRTRLDFNRFLSERDQQTLTDSLSAYYTAHGSWNGVDDVLRNTPSLGFFYSRGMVLADANGAAVVTNGRYAIGEAVPSKTIQDGIAISVGGKPVGYVLFVPPSESHDSAFARPPPDVGFLQRVTSAAMISTGVAALIALVLGIFLARTLTRPLRELTAATEAMARGKLDQQVNVRSRDEIGELAQSFNQMSTDLAHASQLRKQMTADLAHDLRTPLSILRGYTEGLQDGRLQGNAKLYTIMHGEVEHLQHMVEDLRVLSLADAGELPLNRRAVDPLALLERTGLAYIVQAEQAGIGLRIDAPEALPSIAVDTDRMTQVLNNLVSNAMRYTDQGEIVLAARADNTDVCLQVRDTGSGIAAEDLPFIFDRFYRADKSRQRTDTLASSGLGLAITKAIVEAHGGTIAAESAPNVGTTFMITLPVAQEIVGSRQSAVGSRQ